MSQPALLYRVLIPLVFCFLWAAVASAEETPGAAAQPVKIGAIYNLSGVQSALGRPSLRGAQLAIKQTNAAGGVRGRQIELIAYDGKTDLNIVRQQAERLVITDQVVALIGLSDTDMVLAAAPIAARAEKVFLTPGATSPRLPQQVPEYLFLACFGDNVQAAAGAEYAFATLQAKTAYLLFATLDRALRAWPGGGARQSPPPRARQFARQGIAAGGHRECGAGAHNSARCMGVAGSHYGRYYLSAVPVKDHDRVVDVVVGVAMKERELLLAIGGSVVRVEV